MNAHEHLILHLRLDDFHASVEQRLIPALRQRPVVVGKEIVISCSREARQLGVRVGMKTLKVRRRCPAAVVMQGHRDACASLSEAAWACARHYTTALDSHAGDAYGDATGMAYVHGSPLAMGQKLQEEVIACTGLPVTIGLGSNRLLAWMASRQVRAGCIGWIRPYAEARTINGFPLVQLPGLSYRALTTLREMNVERLGELLNFSRDQLRALCGTDGDLLYERCRGLDRHTIDAAQQVESIHRSESLTSPQGELTVLHSHLQGLIEEAMQEVRKATLHAGRCEVALLYDDGKRATRRRCLPVPTAADRRVQDLAEELLAALMTRRVAVRRLSLTIDRLTTASGADDLFGGDEPLSDRGMYHTIDTIRRRYGQEAILTGSRLDMLRPRNGAPGDYP